MTTTSISTIRITAIAAAALPAIIAETLLADADAQVWFPPSPLYA